MAFDGGESIQSALDNLQNDKEEVKSIEMVRVYDDQMNVIKGFNHENRKDKIDKVEETTFFNHKEVITVISPISDEDGTVLGYVNIDFSKKHLLDESQKVSKIYLMITLIIIIGTVIATLFLSKNITDIINALVSNSIKISENIQEGRTDYRANVAEINFQFRDVLEAVNRILDDYEKPLNELATVMSATANKNLTQRVSGNYKGKFKRFCEQRQYGDREPERYNFTSNRNGITCKFRQFTDQK